ncbi:hypothetical protein [Micromonospora sp. U21]|uniref:hypothetical protein n=1 Tax=Micromonospora sp. U21 TaxID=2824899 RepID=UPI001B362C48|nr:hypothetical protein [Micromonospora sp. U21]MBQ0902124.1 hypothetical protein [Micromonospora sp. U21]
MILPASTTPVRGLAVLAASVLAPLGVLVGAVLAVVVAIRRRLPSQARMRDDRGAPA